MSDQTRVADAWKRIEAWFSLHAPPYLKALNPPATPAAIGAAEEALGLTFPPALRASLSIHDGQTHFNEILGAWELNGLEVIVDRFEVYCGLVYQGPLDIFDDASPASLGVRQVVWSRSWIPIAGNGGGTYLAVDVDPAAGGEVGQIIQFSFDDDIREVVAPGLAAWLEEIAQQFESGLWVPGMGGSYLDRRDDDD